MKRVLLVGKFTPYFREVSKDFMGKYEMKTCVNQLEMFKGIAKINQPEIVVIVADVWTEAEEDILGEMYNTYEGVPVVCTGIYAEKAIETQYIEVEHFVFMPKVFTPEKLLETVDNLLNGKQIGATAEKAKSSDNESKEKSNKKSILLVDDSGVYLRTMKGLIGDGYDVSMTTSGLNAIKLIHEKRPDLILLDYEMPMYDGKQTLKAIRESEQLKDIPVVFVTAVNKKENIEAVLKLRPAGYLLKPVDKDRLMQMIKDIIE